MADLFAWLISFFLLIGIIGILIYQVMCLADLEFDYINPYDSASRINKTVLPEFVTQGSLCLLHLLTGHWLMFFICLPHSYYNFRLFISSLHAVEYIMCQTADETITVGYTRKQHTVDVTEIFNQLPWEKKLRIYKLLYLVIVLFLSIFWMIWSIVEEHD